MKGVRPLEIAKKHELTKGIDIIQSRLVIGHEILTTGVHGVGAGAVVGTTLAQTLSNKTLTNPIVSVNLAFTGNPRIYQDTDTRWVTILGGTWNGGHGAIIDLTGKDYAGYLGAMQFRTPNTAQNADLTRIHISGSADVAVLTLTAVTVTGLKLSGFLDMATQNLVGGIYHMSIVGANFNLAETGVADRFVVDLTNGHVSLSGTQVLAEQQAAVADATDAPSVILRLNELLARCRTHGLIAT